MEIINTLLPEIYRTAIGWTIVHSFWQILLISLILYVVLSLSDSKSAAVKYNISFASLFLILLVSTSTFFYCLSEAKHNYSEEVIVIFPSHSLQDADLSLPIHYSTYLLAELETHIPLLVNIWIVGALLFLFRLGNNFSTLSNLRKSAKTHLPKDLVRFTIRQKIKLGISQKIAVLSSHLVQSPITFGNLKPVILIPTSLIFQLTPAQLEAIITHELAHVRRHDYLLNIIQSVLEMIFFYHPCFWWINTYVREQRENACDDLAVKMGIDPKDLAQGLAEVLNHAHESTPDMAMAAGAKNYPTLNRIKRILGFEKPKTQFPSLISYTMIFTILISASLALGATHIHSLESDLNLDPELSLSEELRVELHPLNDTLPLQKRIFVIPKDELEELSELDENSMPAMKKHLLIIKGDTQRMYLPSKARIEILNDSLLANFPRYKIDSVFVKKFRSSEADTAFLKKFKSFKIDTSIVNDDFTKRLEMTIEKRAKELETHGLNLEKQILLWTEKNQPYLENLEKKIQEKEIVFFDNKKISEDLEPKIKALEKKIEEMQKELTPKIEEFQQKIEQWQKDNSKQLEELQKLIQEEVKKGDN